MSIATQINRIEANRNTIRDKLVELGMATTTDKLDTLAAAIENLVNRGAVSVTVQEGDTYTIPAGYHNGSGTVSGVAGGGNYSLQSKSVTPTKKQQSITPDSGYYGLSDVTVAAIPEAFQNVSSVTAAAADVLTGKVIVLSNGTVVTGTMPNKSGWGCILAANADFVGDTNYTTIPAGYHDGTGKAIIELERKTVTPTKSQQVIVPTNGKVMNKVTVEPIPNEFQDVSGVTAVSADVLGGKKIVTVDGEVVGSMTNNGAIVGKIDGLTTTSYTVPKGFHNGSGTVSLTSDVEDALSAI